MFSRMGIAAAAFASAGLGLAGLVEPAPGSRLAPGNRHGGYKPARSKYRPHQGKAEIARRLRHAERDRANQIARGKSREVLTSRRGYYICEA